MVLLGLEGALKQNHYYYMRAKTVCSKRLAVCTSGTHSRCTTSAAYAATAGCVLTCFLPHQTPQLRQPTNTHKLTHTSCSCCMSQSLRCGANTWPRYRPARTSAAPHITGSCTRPRGTQGVGGSARAAHSRNNTTHRASCQHVAVRKGQTSMEKRQQEDSSIGVVSRMGVWCQHMAQVPPRPNQRSARQHRQLNTP
jgi:hypothetical protein